MVNEIECGSDMIPEIKLSCDKIYITNISDQLPERYIINKGATILFWKDGTKTVVKLAKGDEYNKVLGFLWAYFQKRSGLSKTKANEYIRNLVEEEEKIPLKTDGLKIGDRVEVKSLCGVIGTIYRIDDLLGYKIKFDNIQLIPTWRQENELTKL